MIERLSRNKRNWVLALLGLVFVWFAWSIRAVVNPLLIGYLLAFILHPLVERVQLLGFSRRTAVNLVFLAGFLLATGILFLPAFFMGGTLPVMGQHLVRRESDRQICRWPDR